MSSKSIVLISILSCLVFIQNINAEDEFKKTFGEKLETAIISKMQMLTMSLAKAAEDFYHVVPNEIDLSENVNAAIKEQLIYLEKSKEKISDKNSATLIEIIKDYATNIFYEIDRSHLLVRSTDTEKSKIMRKLIDDCRQKVLEAMAAFMNNIRDEWMKLYVTIPDEEKEKHVEYKKINDLFETSKTENEKKIAMPKAMREISDFFEFNGWNEFLNGVPSP